MKGSTNFNRTLLANAVLAGMIGHVSLALAQEDNELSSKKTLEVIQVTAQKTVQNIQDVPISITAMNGEMLEDAGIHDLAEMSAYVPNLTISSTALNTNIYMRGMGSGNNRAFEQSVGMFIDGIYMGRDKQFRSPFLDLERAEVLRGPQGILFGKNTIAGTLNLSTARPTGDQELSGSVGLEWEPEYNGKIYTAVLDKGLSDEFAVRLAVKKGSSDGYMTNSYLHTEEPATDEQVVRLSLNWQPTDALEANLKLESSDIKVTGSSAQVVALNPLNPTANFVAGMVLPAIEADYESELDLNRSADDFDGGDFRKVKSKNLALNVDYKVDAGTFNFVSGHSTYNANEGWDADFMPLPFLHTTDLQKYTQDSQEVRFASNGNNTFDYITGLYYQNSELDSDFWSQANVQPILPVLNAGFMQVPAALLNPVYPGTLWDIGLRPENFSRSTQFTQDSKTMSGFFQGTYRVSDDFRVVLGGRYSKEDKKSTRQGLIGDVNNTVFASAKPGTTNGLVTATILKVGVTLPEFEGKRSESQFTPSLKLQYDLNDYVMLYATAEKGFKSGGFNAAPDATLANQEFEEERATGFELGLKSDILDGAGRLNMALFRTQFDNLQVTTWNGFGFEVGNAAESVTQGFEMDGKVILNNNFTFSGSFAYLDSSYNRYPGGPCSAEDIAKGLSQCDLKDKTTPFAPKLSANLFLEYLNELTTNIEFKATLNLNHSDDVYLDTDLDKNLKQDALSRINLQMSLLDIDGVWEVSLVGKNLTDERVMVAGTDVPLVSGAYLAYTDMPRTWTLQLKYNF